jgi:hypothetical protein
VIAAIGSAVLCAFIVYFDNVNRATTNGLWKSFELRPWVDRVPARYTEASNLLYYPAIGWLVRLLPEGTFGAVWQRMAFVNAFIGGAVLALTYAMALRLFRSRAAALVAGGAQLAMGFFLLLTTINEDIMPGYGWFVAAVACAVLPRRLTAIGLVVTAQGVALAWLFHSSLQLPAVGAFVLGIAAWAGDLRKAGWRVALFVGALVPLPIASALWFHLDWWAGLWSGKGIGTGWGGFAASKVVLLWSGIAQAVAGGQNLTSLAEVLAYPRVLWAALTTIAIAALGVAWLRAARESWRLPEWRLGATILIAVFVLAEGMNLYIQPQDPQMQIQPMMWVPFAVAAAYERTAGRRAAWRVPLRAGLAASLILLFAGNIRVYAGVRHADSVAMANARAVEAVAPPERTVFLLQGFEGLATWLTLRWGRGVEMPLPGPMPPVPHARQFNAIYMTSELVFFQMHSPDEAAASIARVVERALADDFDVVATDIWAADEAGWGDAFASVSSPDRPLAIRRLLRERYAATEIAVVPGWTRLYRLAPKAAAPQVR